MTEIYSALFIDHDNISAALGDVNQKLVGRFDSDPGKWLEALRSFGIPENHLEQRNIVSRRCYSGSRLGTNRAHFTRAGFEVIDCPPLTSRLKNGADIYIVMDILDYLTRHPRIEEYIILSADADFTPVINRLRRELKRTIIFASENTASSYKNCANDLVDGEFFQQVFAPKKAVSKDGPKSGAKGSGVILAGDNAMGQNGNSDIEATEVTSQPNGTDQSEASKALVQVEELLCEYISAQDAPVLLPQAADYLLSHHKEIVGDHWLGFNSMRAMVKAMQSARLTVSSTGKTIYLPNGSKTH